MVLEACFEQGGTQSRPMGFKRPEVRILSPRPQSVRKHSFRTDILCLPHKNHPSRVRNRENRGAFPSDFRDFLDFGHDCPAVAFDELLNAAAEGDGSSDVVAQRREGEFGGDLFLAPAEEMAAVVAVLDGAEGMLAGLLAELLLANVPPDEHHDALFGAL